MPTSTAFDEVLKEKLWLRQSTGLLRELITADTDFIDFCSNDYLGYARLAELQPATHAMNGATGSRLVSGNTTAIEQTEALVAHYHGGQAALIFNNGYAANIGLLSSIAQRGDTIIIDELAHASIIDGARLSLAQHYKFKHNDIEDLEKKIRLAKGTCFVVTESLFSMDGDMAPLQSIATLCAQHGALLIVDEAHATGVYGSKGDGLVAELELQEQVFARVFTFGKALGLHGAAVVGSHTLRQYLINHARSFIYSTALPPHASAQIATAYTLLPHADRAQLMALIAHFKTAIKQLSGYTFIDSHSPIQALIIGSNDVAKQLSAHLLNNGYFVKAILSPTVPVGTERLRICLHLHNTKTDIDQLISHIQSFKA
ncbi:MAG: 8-amino-7-oxononanoate synthase [Bacteroidota bacterium]